MLRPARIAAAAVAIAALAGCTSVPEGVRPVTGFDIDRYLGTWYEVARLNHSFERGLSEVTATYSLNADGSVRVDNRGRSDAGECESREGRATFVGSPDIASLGVSFFAGFEGGYHVIELDPDYRFAVVSGPTKGYFWVLSRTPSLPAPTVERILRDASAAGYPIDEIILVDQSGPGCLGS